MPKAGSARAAHYHALARPAFSTPLKANVRLLKVDHMQAKPKVTEAQTRLEALELENRQLKAELLFLKTHTSIAQGMRGETLIAKAINAAQTSYAAPYDLEMSTGTRIEVKYSKLHKPGKTSPTRRWNWGKPLGWLDKGKEYEFLILIGERDNRYPDQYPDETPYIYFLLPKAVVPDVMDKGASIGGMIQVTTNLAKLKDKQAPATLLKHQVSFAQIEPILAAVTSSQSLQLNS